MNVDERKAAALRHRCPFCHADPGEPCRTRNSSREQEWPHSRRVALGDPIDDRYRPTHVDALCCVCGNQRTVNSDYHRRSDPNHAQGDEGTRRGWRSTQTLKCQECGRGTRHAILTRTDRSYRFYDEEQQRIALGGDPGDHSGPWVERLRREYRDMPFPRNPKLHHWFSRDAAEEALKRGETHMQALCGDTDTIPRGCAKRGGESGPVAPGRIDWETEFEDTETGEWWVDMDCVNCLRVTNERRATGARQRLQEFLIHFAARPELVSDIAVGDLLQ